MTEGEGARHVRGSIALPAGGHPVPARIVHVQVEDVSRLDVPSHVVAEQRLDDVDLTSTQAIPFRVEVPADLVAPGHRYAVRVHVDVTGTGEVTKGDLVSTASHPVLSGDDDEVVVPVRPV